MQNNISKVLLFYHLKVFAKNVLLIKFFLFINFLQLNEFQVNIFCSKSLPHDWFRPLVNTLKWNDIDFNNFSICDPGKIGPCSSQNKTFSLFFIYNQLPKFIKTQPSIQFNLFIQFGIWEIAFSLYGFSLFFILIFIWEIVKGFLQFNDNCESQKGFSNS